MDPVPAEVILVPILVPISTSMDIHPLLLGILVLLQVYVDGCCPFQGSFPPGRGIRQSKVVEALVVMFLCIGKITPPYGISLLLACAIAEVPLSKAMKYTLIFLGAFCLVMLAIIFLPNIALSIPRYFMPELFAH